MRVTGADPAGGALLLLAADHEAARKLVEGHARGSALVEDLRAHKIERPDVHVPQDDRWSRIAAEVAAFVPKREEPDETT